ncbi:hypothetical protein V6N12_013962 [Hibiscus sabdariffa]|uniref:Uncharacterized protein n=1 Tax=Hibiscus sabdariffa TaxID=183260 RepID=A0ABR2B136_9ROSI
MVAVVSCIAAGKAQKSRSICKSRDQMILSGLFHTKKFSCDLSIETGLPPILHQVIQERLMSLYLYYKY